MWLWKSVFEVQQRRMATTLSILNITRKTPTPFLYLVDPEFVASAASGASLGIERVCSLVWMTLFRL